MKRSSKMKAIKIIIGTNNTMFYQIVGHMQKMHHSCGLLGHRGAVQCYYTITLVVLFS